MTGGISKDKLWKCLVTLKDCQVIQWDRGRTGVANNYTLLGIGCWRKKVRVDNSQKRVDKSRRPVRHTDQGGPPDRPPVVRQTEPNQNQLNQNQLTRDGSLISIVDNLVEKIRDRSKGIKA